MNNQIKIITPPDLIFDNSYKILVICPKEDLKKSLESWIIEKEFPISIYYFTLSDTDIKWLLTCANICDKIILELDEYNENAFHFQSYLLGLSNTYYRCEHKKVQWELINQNRFYDFSDFRKEFNDKV